MNILIMAGGRGERFWPVSSPSTPKQILPIISDKTMIEETVDRLLGFAEYKNIFISTNSLLKPKIKKLIPAIPSGNFILEPCARNTAAAIGLGAVYIQNRDPGSVMAVLPADHFIAEKDIFLSDLQIAGQLAKETGCLITFGIKPSRIETGYGYIELGEVVHNAYENSAYEVKSFREKPDQETAREYVNRQEFLWNSGMFIWSVSSIMESIEKYMPVMFSGLMEISENLGTRKESETVQRNFEKFEKTSIDYGVMEKADNALCIRARFTWDDVGSWTAVERFNKKDEQNNMVRSDWKGVDTSGSIIVNDRGLVCTLGVDNLLVIKQGDIVLVADKRREQEIKKIIESLQADGKLKKYLDV
ncbi:MAG: sugar phosphate nucleotidyltransferase [bacterium]|nr:sugar phosphate nucleotidyltransferase [bacterium]